MLAPLFACLYVVALAEQTFHTGSSPSVIAAALTDPLSLIAGRSPGERGKGPLHLTKKPHERVLAAVHHRDPAPADSAGTSESPGDLGLGPQVVPPLAEDTSFPTTTPFTFGLPNTPLVYPSDPGPPNTQPNGPNPPPVGAPEPASWTLMLFGLLAPAMALRRRRRAG